MRQLNFYNFRKVNRERHFWIYRHKQFHRDRPENLHLLRRRTCPGVDGRKQRNESESTNTAIDGTLLNGTADGSSTDIYIEGYAENSTYNSKSVASSESEFDANLNSMNLVINNGFVHHKPSRPSLLQKGNEVYKYGNFPRTENNSESMYRDELLFPTNGKLSKDNGTENKRPDRILNVNLANNKHEYLTVLANMRNTTKYLQKDSTSDEFKTSGQYLESNVSGTINENKVKTDFFGASNSGIGGNNFYDDKKQSAMPLMKKIMHESTKESILVSQIMHNRDSQAGAQCGTWASGIESGSGGLVTPPSVFGDTMRYNALTYDDEVNRSTADDLIPFEKRKLESVLTNSLKKQKSEAVVTDESDNSESDDIMSTISTSKHFHTLGNQMGILDTKEVDLFFNANQAHSSKKDAFHHALVASINRKLLHGLGPIAPRDDKVDRHPVSASISCFCILNNPLDAELEYKVDLLFQKCFPLYEEFQHYRNALSPDQSCCNQLNQQKLEKLCNTEEIRDFKVFAVNRMEDLLAENNQCLNKQCIESLIYLNKDEASVLHASIEMWCFSISRS